VSSVPSVVIDNAQCVMKCGFAGDKSPRVIIPTATSVPKSGGMGITALGQKNSYIGPEAVEKRGLGKLSCPIVDRTIVNWSDMEKIWHHCFYSELKVVPEEQPVLLSERTLNPKENREKMTEIMFEGFNVPALFINNTAVLSLYASGKSTGFVVDSGYGGTDCVPVYEGYALKHWIQKLDIAGKKITDYLMKILSESGYTFSTPSDREIVTDMKHNHAYVCYNIEEEFDTASQSNSLEKRYTLPDGNIIALTTEHFRCTEPLFNPSLLNSDSDSLSEAMFKSIQLCDIDIRKQLYGNTVIAGGSSMFPGLADRIIKEVTTFLDEPDPDSKEILSTKYKVDITEVNTFRDFMVWIGGSILATLDTYPNMCITKQNYEEEGVSIVHYKC